MDMFGDVSIPYTPGKRYYNDTKTEFSHIAQALLSDMTNMFNIDLASDSAWVYFVDLGQLRWCSSTQM